MVLCFRDTQKIEENPARAVIHTGEILRVCLQNTAGSSEARFSGK